VRGTFIDVASLLFCAGALTVVGSFEDRLPALVLAAARGARRWSGAARQPAVEGNTNTPSVVATHQYRLDNRRIVAIVRVSGLKGQPAGFRQYKAPNLALRRKLARRIGKLKNGTIEVGPGQKVPKTARRLRR
jgi:hypothetical protein